MLKFVYSLFLGLLLVVFVGMGVETFYPSPKAPEYPKALEVRAEPAKDYTAQEKQIDRDYQNSYEAYSADSQDYNRNVAMIVLGAAVILMVVGLLLESRAGIFADGLLLGGTFTLLYSIGRSFSGDDPKYSFVVISVGLVVTMAVGYLKFVKPPKPTKKK